MDIISNAFISLPADGFRSYLEPELVNNPDLKIPGTTDLFNDNMTSYDYPGVSYISLPANHYRSQLTPKIQNNPSQTSVSKQLFSRTIYEYRDFAQEPNSFRDGTGYSAGSTIRPLSDEKNKNDLTNDFVNVGLVAASFL